MKAKSVPLRLFDRNSASGDTLNVQAAKYQGHVDHQESLDHSGHNDSRTVGDNRQNEKSHRGVHFAFLPETYEPLVDEEQDEAKEEKKKRKKEKYKKVRKVGVLLMSCCTENC